VRAPPGERSSRKQPEQSRRTRREGARTDLPAHEGRPCCDKGAGPDAGQYSLSRRLRRHQRRAGADAQADVVLPAIREAQAAGAKSLRAIAAALNGRGIANSAGRDVGSADSTDDWAKGLIGGAVVGKDEEVRVHLVEIAIGILRADPKEDVTPARAWAIDVIEKNSGVKFLAEDRAALLHKPILAIWDQSSWDQSSWGQQLAPPPTAPLKDR
jgi:hypothetical protein